MNCGRIRVGRIVYSRGGKPNLPPLVVDDVEFVPIIVMMKSHDKSLAPKEYRGRGKVRVGWSSLSPYILHWKHEKGDVIFENFFQSSKIFENIPASKQHYSKWDRTIIWEHPAETHIDKDGNVTPAYYEWRQKLMHNPYPVRYPVGFHHRSTCVGAFKSDENFDPTGELLDYIEGRKQIYVPGYIELASKHPDFQELKKLVTSGTNIMICEVDGPHLESLSYYQEKYDVDENFIVNESVEATDSNLEILLSDPKHPFGHGYCLAMALLM